MARHLDLIAERRRCLERVCEYRRAELSAAVDELHRHWQPMERTIGKIRRVLTPGVMLGGLGLSWLAGPLRIVSALVRGARFLWDARHGVGRGVAKFHR